MKILYLAVWYPYPPDNGYKLRVYHLLRALGTTHTVTLLSFAFATAQPTQKSPLHSWCRDIKTVEIDPFAANRAGALHTFLSPTPTIARAVPAMRQITRKLLHTQAFDAVIASTEVMAVYAQLTPPSTARILEEHNSLTRWMQERYHVQTNPVQKLRCWVSWQKTRYYEARTFRRFDLVTMVSAQDRDTCLVDLPGYRGPVEVVPNGVDCTHNQPGLALQTPNSLVFNGSLTYSANYEAMRWFLAEIYPQIKAARPEIRLTITGSTAGVDLTRLAIDDSVQLTGSVEDVRMPIAEAAIAIAPLRQGGGTRLKILEAMALGTPVVATPKGAEGLDVVDGKHLRLAATPTAIAQATLSLLSDDGERAHMALAARRLVENQYDWSQIGRRFVSLIEQTVHNKQQQSVSSDRNTCSRSIRLDSGRENKHFHISEAPSSEWPMPTHPCQCTRSDT